MNMDRDAVELTDEQIRDIENGQANLPGVTRENLTIRTVRAALIAQHGFCQDEDHCVCAREIGYRVCQPTPSAAQLSTETVDKPGDRVGVPDGWKLVPVEPTNAMCLAMESKILEGWMDTEVWRAALDAAPAASAGDQEASE